ncbi:uncharacterized protein LOC133328304 [Musca vetustissima]|uniref:uncharacterized protein LOC133328304 n=1 Tax=Musca vetustissima TaxID=27455 RepID=UPI002AB6E6D9|nr:uncharacterized protein LOC133328304 [Musca vetustissima]
MKYFTILTLIVVLGLTSIKATSEEEFRQFKAACEEENPLNSDELINFGDDPANNALLKSLEMYPSFTARNHQVLQAVDDCHTATGANDCETAYKLMMCLKNHGADVYGAE